MRYPTTLLVSLCAPLLTLGLARLGAGPLATHPAFVTHSDAPEDLMEDDTLIVNTISAHARRAERHPGSPQAIRALAEAQRLVGRLSTPKGRRVAEQRLSRAQGGKMPPCVSISPGTSPHPPTPRATPSPFSR